MYFPFKVLAVSASRELEIFHAVDKFTACVESMRKNTYTLSRSIIFIVVCPKGKRLSITEQQNYLSFSQEYKKEIKNANN